MTLHEQTSQQNRSETGAQPSSRRALRESERRAAAGDTGQVDPTEHPSGVYDLNQSGSYDIWDTISRRAASQLTDAADEAERRTGRRVAPGNSGAMTTGNNEPEPSSYVTRSRPNVPTYDGPTFRNRSLTGEAPRVPAPATPLSSAPPQSAPAQPSAQPGGYRQRDYSPRRSPEDTGLTPSWQIRPTPPLLAESAPVAAASAAAPVAPAPSANDTASLDFPSTLDHTMTRRELRAMQERAALMPQSAVEAPPAAPGWLASRDENPAVGIEAGPTFGLPRSAFGAVAETATVEMSVIDRFELEASEPVTAPITMPRVFAQAVAEDPTLLDDHVETVVAEEVVEESAAELPAPRSAAAAWSQVPVAPVAPVVEPTPPTAVIPAAAAAAPAAFTDEPLSGLQGFEALIAQASAGLEAPSVPTGQVRVPEPELERSTLPPTGHWSQDTQDDMLPFEGLLSRDVTSTGGSSRSMIMMEPQPDLMQAVNSTGEIMITGSLDLPHILSSTGAPSNHYDSSEIDRLFEASQDDHHTGNVAPVRASRAVSTHTSTRSVVGPRKRRGGTLPTVLAITAAVMAIGVIGLLFGGYVLRIF